MSNQVGRQRLDPNLYYTLGDQIGRGRMDDDLYYTLGSEVGRSSADINLYYELDSERPTAPTSQRESADGVQASGISMSGLANLSNYFGNGPESIIGVVINGDRKTDLSPEALKEAQDSWRNSNPSARAANFIYDAQDQDRTLPMSRGAMNAFMNAPDGSPMAQIRARNAALGITEQNGKKYVNINGQMREMSDQEYRSVVSRNSEGISGLLQKYDENFVMPGGNAPPQASSPTASTLQQPRFDSTIVDEAVPGSSERFASVMQDKNNDFFGKVYQNAAPGNYTTAEDFSRANQMPINTVEDADGFMRDKDNYWGQ